MSRIYGETFHIFKVNLKIEIPRPNKTDIQRCFNNVGCISGTKCDAGSHKGFGR